MTSTTPTTDYTIRIAEPEREVLVSVLTDHGFEGFWEDDDVLHAYIATGIDDSAQTQAAIVAHGGELIAHAPVELANWNSKWEEHYEPVQINPHVQILADFHEPQPGYRFTVRLHPRMAFGTGHHSTTRLVLQQMFLLEHTRPYTNLNVLDYGCGTGILGLMAAAMGATKITLIDFDPVATENAALNLGLNNDLLGEAELDIATAELDDLPANSRFDLVLANINRFVHLESLERYNMLLAPNGLLVLGGLLASDEPLIREAFTQAGWQLSATATFEGWLCIQATLPN
jgi:ribosomal protein L11 methyltransferase